MLVIYTAFIVSLHLLKEPEIFQVSSVAPHNLCESREAFPAPDVNPDRSLTIVLECLVTRKFTNAAAARETQSAQAD